MRVDHNGHASLSEWWEEFLEDVKEWLEEEKEEASTNKDMTTTVGLTGSGALGVGGSVSLGVTFDTKGNVGGSLTINGGGGFPSLGAGGYASINNAPTIYDQEGLGTAVGASGEPGVIAVGGDYNTLVDNANGRTYHGGTVSVTYGLYPTIVEVHGEVGGTWVKGVNIYDVAISAVEFLQSLRLE